MTDVYAAIEQLIASDDFAVTAVCQALNVSRSAYYAWCEETPQDRERRDEQLRPAILDMDFPPFCGRVDKRVECKTRSENNA